MQVGVKLPAGPLVEYLGFCQAIAEAIRPTSEQHYQGIECIVGKVVNHRGWMAQHSGGERWAVPAEFQVALRSEDGRTLDELLPDEQDDDLMRGTQLPLDANEPRHLVELAAPYTLSEEDWRSLRDIVPKLPPLRYPISDADATAFLDAWCGLKDRPAWMPVLVTAAHIERCRSEQGEMAMRHQQALKGEFARRQLVAVDAGYASVASLVPGSFIPRESAIAYLHRCGLVPDDGGDDIVAGHKEQSPEPGQALATMPPMGIEPVDETYASPARARFKDRAANAKAHDSGQKGERADVSELPQPATDAGKRKVGKVLRLRQVEELTGLKRSSIYNRMDSGSPYYDPTFPKCFSLSTSGTGAVGWEEEQVKAWVVRAQAGGIRD